MQITHPHTLLILAWLAIGQLCTGCSAEDIAGEAPSEMGVLCLQMSSDEVFIETRADNDYVWAFQITGDNYSNNNVELGKDIIWFTLETLQKYGFLINTPQDVSMDKSNRRFVARCERTFGAGDFIG